MRTHESTEPAIRRLNLFGSHRKNALPIAARLLDDLEKTIGPISAGSEREVKARFMKDGHDAKALKHGLQACIEAANGNIKKPGAEETKARALKLANIFGIEGQMKPEANPPGRSRRLMSALMDMNPFQYRGFWIEFIERFKESLLLDEATEALEDIAGPVPETKEKEAPAQETKEETFKKGRDLDQADMIRDAVMVGDMESAKDMCLMAREPETALVATLTLIETGREEEIKGFMKMAPELKKLCSPEAKCFELAERMDNTTPKEPARKDTLLDALIPKKTVAQEKGPEM